MKKYIEPLIHVLFWLLVFYITYVNFGVRIRMVKAGETFEYTKTYKPFFLATVSIAIFFKALLFYGNAHILFPKLIESQNRRNHIIRIALFFALTLISSLLINYLIAKNFMEHEIGKGSALVSYSIFLHFLFLFLSVGYRLAKDWFKNELIKNQIVQEKLVTELNFLKAQINPHFLFNTLNNLYAEAHKLENKNVANGIAKLSHIMRYMIYDSNAPFVSLDKEIKYLESYIALQKLRLSEQDPLDLKVDIATADTSVKVAPILFIPFVENAFKYGFDIENNSFIHITLKTAGNDILFTISNSKHQTNRIEEHSGVGLKNVIRRLSLLYPDKHELIIEDDTVKYTVRLRLQTQK